MFLPTSSHDHVAGNRSLQKMVSFENTFLSVLSWEEFMVLSAQRRLTRQSCDVLGADRRKRVSSD
jgi:hypothetical protein